MIDLLFGSTATFLTTCSGRLDGAAAECADIWVTWSIDMALPDKRRAPIRADYVEELRNSRAIKAETLADRVGVSLRSYNRWIAGSNQPFLENIAALARELATTVDAIRADEPATRHYLVTKPETFHIQLELKGQFVSSVQKDYLSRVTQETVQALQRQGIVVTGQQVRVDTTGFNEGNIWRILVAIPTSTNGLPSWILLAVHPKRLTAVLESAELSLEAFADGEVVAFGWGSRLPRSISRRAARWYGGASARICDLTPLRVAR